MSKTIVVALGGNAILTDDPSAQGQQQAIDASCDHLVKLVEEGHRLIITHGNGPQVGNLLLQHLTANSQENPAFPLDSLVAMTEGSIGYWLQNSMQNKLAERGLDKSVVSVVTQVLVDKQDPAFDNLTKPIGPFYSKEEAQAEMERTGDQYVEDAGRGWRKVVASPQPLAIKEIDSIRALVESGSIVIAAGGGGIPVVEDNGQLQGVEAVIDKDFASQILATALGADQFIVLTGVDNVYINFNQPDQKKLEKVTVEEMEDYVRQDQFAAGSMLPKVQAGIGFVKARQEGQAVITSLENLRALLEEEAGTIIEK